MARIITTILENIRAAAAAHYREARIPRLLDVEDAVRKTPLRWGVSSKTTTMEKGKARTTVLIKEDNAKMDRPVQTPLPLHSMPVEFSAHQRLNPFS